jgi:hypothetical protein
MRFTVIVLTVLALAAAAAPAAASGKVVVIGDRAAGNNVPWRGTGYDALRFQCLWRQGDIAYAGYVNGVEFEKTTAATGRFNNVRAWLCHTSKTTLERTFANNYTGNTPRAVLNMRSVTVGGTGWFDLGIQPARFNYNNRDNLLLELRWNGDNGVSVPCWRSSRRNSRCYAPNHTASEGTVFNNGQRIRLTIGTMTGVAPTSLGRLRALYR